eukprot:CAMPEP_0119122068 /NCGR_PEP_ID=MMETSP1310-20130426/2442_1 /TAXON_ID=464262 /ORGANISM="Genus nov. species nov., Strain RCC2339" /LENGTH=314 /DNA_ID=CAMNT_0007111675 /DNA_START=77 /DNA_END=1021 /DNA_ORIENTATION=+
MAEGKFDGLFINLAQQHEGIEPLLHSFFGFLERKTDFFVHHDDPQVAETMMLKVLRQHSANALAKKKLKAERDAKTQQQREEARRLDAERRKKEEPELGIVEVVEDEKEEEKEATKNEDMEVDESAVGSDDAVLPVADDNATVKQKPNEGNGGKTEKYEWTQTLQEVDLRISLPEGTRGRDVDVEVKKQSITVTLKGKTVIAGQLHKAVHTGDPMWSVEDRKELLVTLEKVNKMEWWNCVIVGHPEIDTQKVQPENSKLSDLDGETRGTVEKMMFDSRQKAMGLPTSDDLQKQEMLKKFMDANPQMDFSQAKIC